MIFTTINHQIRRALQLSLIEYCVADSIYYISKSSNFRGAINRNYLAGLFGVHRATITRTIDELIRRKILTADGNNTTEAWNNIYISKDSNSEVLQNATNVLQNVAQSVAKCDTIYINNNNINKKKTYKRKILMELSFDDLIEVWNSVEINKWRKFNSEDKASGVYRNTFSLYSDTFRYKATKEDFYIALENYLKEIQSRNPDTDYANHRFSLYQFIKQSNGFDKFLTI